MSWAKYNFNHHRVNLGFNHRFRATGTGIVVEQTAALADFSGTNNAHQSSYTKSQETSSPRNISIKRLLKEPK